MAIYTRPSRPSVPIYIIISNYIITYYYNIGTRNSRRPAINVIRIVRFGCTGPDHDGPINHKRLTISRTPARARTSRTSIFFYIIYIIYVTRTISCYCYYYCISVCMTMCTVHAHIYLIRIFCRDVAMMMMMVIIILASRRPSLRRPLSPTAARVATTTDSRGLARLQCGCVHRVYRAY